MIVSALNSNCDYLLTEDMADGQIIENRLTIDVTIILTKGEYNGKQRFNGFKTCLDKGNTEF
jgi:hypothetical protein